MMFVYANIREAKLMNAKENSKTTPIVGRMDFAGKERFDEGCKPVPMTPATERPPVPPPQPSQPPKK
jgi:hypothetical protein